MAPLSPSPAPDRDGSIHSVHRAVSVLQVVAHRGTARVTEIAAELSLHKSTVSRLLSTLESRGLVEAVGARGGYVLGDGVARLAAGSTRRPTSTVVVRGVCVELADAVGETVTVTVPAGDEVLSVDEVVGPGVLAASSWIGRRSPIHATSSGKLFLAERDPDDVARLVHGAKAYTPATITDVGTMAAELDRVRDQGHALALDEQERGLTAVSVPIRDLHHEVVAALTISGPTVRLPHDVVESMLPPLRDAAARISERNGYPRPE